MKRINNLIEKIAGYENINLAFYKAKKQKAIKKDVILYRKELQENIKILQKQILDGNIEIGNYNYFKIYDPKERIICAAPFSQRVLHHSIMNICQPYFEQKQIFDSYACRKGKGQYKALERAVEYNKKNNWYLKLDFKKYFDSIDHKIMLTQLKNIYKDEKLLEVFRIIIESYETEKGKGMPIGNLTSQYFANHYLVGLDRFIKEELKLEYVRYMDDMVCWHKEKEELLKSEKLIREYSETKLELKLKPMCFNKREKGLPFLGYLLFKGTIKLSQRSRKRYANKMKDYKEKLNNNEWNQKEYQNHIIPLNAFTEKSESLGFRKRILMSIGQIEYEII